MEYVTRYLSQKGIYHDINEDRCIVHDDFIIIADGMGGESSGEIASQLAILTISSILKKHLSDMSTESEIKNLSFMAIMKADKEIIQYGSIHPDSIGMGTTILLIIRKQQKGYVAWCGDSRGYLYSESTLHSITKDHSFVQEMIDNKKISEEEAFTHPDNNLLTKYVGGGEGICLPEFTSIDLNENSIVVLCSDGLSGYCKNEEICKEISLSQEEDLPSRLLKLAIKNGSDDDITIATMTVKKKRKSIWSWLCGKRQQ